MVVETLPDESPVTSTLRVPAEVPYAPKVSVAPDDVDTHPMVFGTMSLRWPVLFVKVICCVVVGIRLL